VLLTYPFHTNGFVHVFPLFVPFTVPGRSQEESSADGCKSPNLMD
jgi:hypothetical protein